ncbi:MAG: hypothetical protein HZC42_13965 [Candidatus Eisenbacteria bacterium]|nr:hypothetical protein [Candidatus Eisenbacteria bacterium]
MEKERMERAFDVAAKAFRDVLQRSNPEDAELLAQAEPGEIVEVLGDYDHIGRVLRAIGVPFVQVAPADLAGIDWARAQVVWVNCPGRLPATALRRLVQWVREGGHLGTTDWALKHLLERAFPGRVKYTGGSIPDCVVRVEPVGDHPLLAGFREDGRDPLWWMEGASYPCEVLDRDRVRVLVKSAEVGRRFGADAVVVEWDEGEGRIVHLVSHLYLQRSETRTARDRETAAAYFKGVGIEGESAARLAAEAGDLFASELKGAFTGAGLATSLFVGRKRRMGK